MLGFQLLYRYWVLGKWLGLPIRASWKIPGRYNSVLAEALMNLCCPCRFSDSPSLQGCQAREVRETENDREGQSELKRSRNSCNPPLAWQPKYQQNMTLNTEKEQHLLHSRSAPGGRFGCNHSCLKVLIPILRSHFWSRFCEHWNSTHFSILWEKDLDVPDPSSDPAWMYFYTCTARSQMPISFTFAYICHFRAGV